VPLDDWRRWWRWQPGAHWRRPEGPHSTLHGLDHHPVVHIGWEDAQAYAAWAGKRLPTEPEWEHAARGGLDGATYPWGSEFLQDGRIRANTWQGAFPHHRLRLYDGAGTSRVKTFPPNGYGLYDVAGNVWEWTTSPWTSDHAARFERATAGSCCAPTTVAETDRRVIKGGSHLCAPSYCHRYRPAARKATPCAARPITWASDKCAKPSARERGPA
jgi:formylglycine-generating enzyme